MERKLILNDGTELDGYLIDDETKLFLYIFNLTLAEGFELLNDPEKTKVIKSEQYGTKATYRGFKHLCAISEERDNMISAVVKKV